MKQILDPYEDAPDKVRFQSRILPEDYNFLRVLLLGTGSTVQGLINVIVKNLVATCKSNGITANDPQRFAELVHAAFPADGSGFPTSRPPGNAASRPQSRGAKSVRPATQGKPALASNAPSDTSVRSD